MPDNAEGNVGMTWEQAIDEAKREHSTEEQAADTDQALQEGRNDETETASAEGSEGQEAESPDSDTQQTAENEDQLLTKEELEELKTQNPKLAKVVENLTAFRAKVTRDSQTVAAERKQMQAYMPWIQRLEADPVGTLKVLAKEAGLQIVGEEAAQPKDVGLDQAIAEALREAGIPEDLDDALVQPLSKGLSKALGAMLDRELGKRMQPFQQDRERSLNEQIDTKLKDAHTAFAAKYPDWKSHEAKMTDIANKLLVGPDGKHHAPNMEPLEFMEMCYAIAAGDKKTAVAAKKIIERQSRASRNAEENSGVAPHNVSDSLPRGASWEDSVRAAKRELAQRR